MWANKDKYGYDNDNVIYRSFTPDYVVWEACVDGVWTESWDNHKPVIKTKSELEKAIAEIKRG